VGRTSSLLVAMQRALAAFGLGAALLFGVRGERAMEHAGDIQQLGDIDFADVEKLREQWGDFFDGVVDSVKKFGKGLIGQVEKEAKKKANEVMNDVKKKVR